MLFFLSETILIQIIWQRLFIIQQWTICFYYNTTSYPSRVYVSKINFLNPRLSFKENIENWAVLQFGISKFFSGEHAPGPPRPCSPLVMQWIAPFFIQHLSRVNLCSTWWFQGISMKHYCDLIGYVCKLHNSQSLESSFFMSKCKLIYMTNGLNSRVVLIGKINIEANKFYYCTFGTIFSVIHNTNFKYLLTRKT